MTSKRLAQIAVLLLLAVGGSLAVVVWALLETPDFYEETLQYEVRLDPVVRRQAARQLEVRTKQFAEEIQHADLWSEEFTQSQVNAWLAEELQARFGHMLPAGVHDPRVQFVAGTVRVGFRLEHKDWSGVVSLELKPAVADGNRLAVQVESIHAGLVPVPVEEILRRATRQFETHGWPAEWSESNGTDVLTVQLPNDQEPGAILETVKVTEGMLHISGRRESSPSSANDSSMSHAQRPNNQSIVN